MARYGVVVLLIVMMAATAIVAGACGTQRGGGTQQQVGKMQRESKSVDLKNAQSARAQLKIGAGELTLPVAQTSSWRQISPTTSQSGNPK
jgi:hypothetical protein